MISFRNYNATIDAKNNWWSTVVEGEIEGFIKDANTHGALEDDGVVDFVPFLMQAVETAGVL